MKFKISAYVLLVISILVLFSTFVSAVPTVISSCQSITSSGVYILESNINTFLVHPSGCIYINAPEVNLNCKGYSINGNGGIGVNVYSTNHITIQNCSIQDFDKNIHLNEVTYGQIKNNILSYTTEGIFLNQSTNLLIHNNVFDSSVDKGIKLVSSDSNTINNNNIIIDNFGLYLDDSDQNTIQGNTIETAYDSYPEYGIYLDSSSDNSITGNLIDAYFYGTYLSASNYNLINLNQITVDIYDSSAEGTGVYNTYSSNNLISRNIIQSGDEGIVLDFCFNEKIKENKVYACDEGIVFNLDNSAEIKQNTFTALSYDSNRCPDIFNDFAGIYGYSGSYNTISENVFHNLRFGVLLTEGYNTIYNNFFFDNTYDAYESTSIASGNTWDSLDCSKRNILGGACIGGNYWDDYTGSDTDSDGFGETSLPYDSEIVIGGDYLPLVGSVNYISSCDDDPDSSGTWIVSEDIEVSLESDETCIDILSDDVAIVCGNLIEGNGLGTAIDVNGYNNAIIKNCFISNFETGIALSGATDTRLINNVIY